MSDEEITEDKPSADGTDCPAAQSLCWCGVRGCPDERRHARAKRGRESWRWRK